MHLRTITASLVALALLAPTGAAEPLLKQIDNGGFEEFENDDPVEWRNVSGEVTKTSDAYVGDSAARLNTVGDDVFSIIAQNVSLEREDAPIVPLAEYDFDFAAALAEGEDDDNPSTSSPEARAKVLWKNALGETVREDAVPVDTPNDVYVEFNETFQAPADAVEAEVQFELEKTGDTARTDAHLNIDDVAFGPAEPEAPA